MIRISEHAAERAKERCNLTGDALQRLADKAFQEGIKHSEMRGRLKRWADNQGLTHGRGPTIHGDFVFIFEDLWLITVLFLPHEYRSVVANMRRKRKASGKGV